MFVPVAVLTCTGSDVGAVGVTFGNSASKVRRGTAETRTKTEKIVINLTDSIIIVRTEPGVWKTVLRAMFK